MNKETVKIPKLVNLNNFKNGTTGTTGTLEIPNKFITNKHFTFNMVVLILFLIFLIFFLMNCRNGIFKNINFDPLPYAIV